jgi:hypothetical protein
VQGVASGTTVPIFCTAANCPVNVSQWGGTALGTPTNFGTTPGAVIAESVNASLFSGTTALGTPNTFGTTAPTGNALGTNAALFLGTTLARTNQTTTAAGVVDVNIVGYLGATASKTNAQHVAIADDTNVITAAVSALGTAPTGTEVMAVNSVNLPSTAAGASLSTKTVTTVTTGQNIKASAGNLYGVFALSGVATTCWIQFLNSASGGTLGTAVIFSVPLPASTTQPIWIQPGNFALANFTSGIAVGVSTTATGSSACGTGAPAIVVEYD